MFSQLSRNSLWLFLARLGTQVGLVLFTVILARELGTQAFGEYAFMAAVVLIGNTLTTFGTDMYLIREIAASADDSLLGPALTLQLLLSALFIVLIFIASWFLPRLGSEAIVAMRIYSLSMIPLAFFTVYTITLRAHQRMLAYSLLNMAIITLQVAAILVLVSLHGGLVGLALLLLLAQCLAALIAASLAHLRLSLVHLRRASFSQVLRLARASASIATLAIIGILYQRLSLLILPFLGGSAVTGWFSAAARVVEAAKMVHIAVFTAIFPMMAQARSAPTADFARALRLPWLILLGGALLAALAISSCAAALADLLYGPAYAASVPLLRILAWTLIPYSINGFLTLAYLARGHTGSILRALAAATIALVVLTVWLFPLAGAPAAALAALSAEIIQAIVLALHLGQARHLVPSASDGRYRLSTQ